MSTQGANNGNGPPLDKGLEDIGRAYGRLEQEQPPELLDQAVLNAARREVEPRPRWTQFGWLHGLTTAAVFVLAFSLILNQREPAMVEETFDFDSSPRKQLAEPAAAEADAEQGTATAIPMESRSLQKSARTPAADTREMELAPQEVVLEEAGFSAADSASAAAGVLEPPPAMAKRAAPKGELQDKPDHTDAERRLAEIMRLKQAGDESWQAALDAFLEQYPDYPLPAELTD